MKKGKDKGAIARQANLNKDSDNKDICCWLLPPCQVFLNNDYLAHLPHCSPVLPVHSTCTGIPIAPLLLKVTISFNYNVNTQELKGPSSQFKSISPPLMPISIKTMMHPWSWFRVQISHFNLI